MESFADLDLGLGAFLDVSPEETAAFNAAAVVEWGDDEVDADMPAMDAASNGGELPPPTPVEDPFEGLDWSVGVPDAVESTPEVEVIAEVPAPTEPTMVSDQEPAVDQWPLEAQQHQWEDAAAPIPNGMPQNIEPAAANVYPPGCGYGNIVGQQLVDYLPNVVQQPDQISPFQQQPNQQPIVYDPQFGYYQVPPGVRVIVLPPPEEQPPNVQYVEEEVEEYDDEQMAEEVEEEEDQSNLKRPRNPFFIWMPEMRQRLMADNPNYRNGELSRALGSIWRSMTDQERHPYVEQSRLEREEFNRLHPNFKYHKNRQAARAKVAKGRIAKKAAVKRSGAAKRAIQVRPQAPQPIAQQQYHSVDSGYSGGYTPYVSPAIQPNGFVGMPSTSQQNAPMMMQQSWQHVPANPMPSTSRQQYVPTAPPSMPSTIRLPVMGLQNGYSTMPSTNGYAMPSTSSQYNGSGATTSGQQQYYVCRTYYPPP